jgi:hypothetical protein
MLAPDTHATSTLNATGALGLPAASRAMQFTMVTP